MVLWGLKTQPSTSPTSATIIIICFSENQGSLHALINKKMLQLKNKEIGNAHIRYTETHKYTHGNIHIYIHINIENSI